MVRFSWFPQNTQYLTLVVPTLGILIRRKEEPVAIFINRGNPICNFHSPFARDDALTPITIWVMKLCVSQNLLNIFVLPCNGNGDGVGRTAEVVAICGAKFAKEYLHRFGGLEGEPCVDTVVRELAGQATKNETAKNASISRSLWITLAVRKAPCCEVKWGVTRRKEAVSTCQSDGVAQNGAAYGVPCTEMMSLVKRAGR
jgi:hypothetical protein